MAGINTMCKQTQDEITQLEALAFATCKKLAVEVIADSSGKFCGNMMRFDDAKSAVAYANDLADRWIMVQEFRIVVAEPV